MVARQVRLKPFYATLLDAVLHLLADDEHEIRQKAMETNTELLQLVKSTAPPLEFQPLLMHLKVLHSHSRGTRGVMGGGGCGRRPRPITLMPHPPTDRCPHPSLSPACASCVQPVRAPRCRRPSVLRPL